MNFRIKFMENNIKMSAVCTDCKMQLRMADHIKSEKIWVVKGDLEEQAEELSELERRVRKLEEVVYGK